MAREARAGGTAKDRWHRPGGDGCGYGPHLACGDVFIGRRRPDFIREMSTSNTCCLPYTAHVSCGVNVMLLCQLLGRVPVQVFLRRRFLDMINFEISRLCFCLLFRAPRVAYGRSQARIRAIAAGLQHNHSNGASELHLRPTPQLTETPDP